MTKSELVDQLDLARRYVQTSEALANRRLWMKPIVPCSVHKKQGLDLLRAQLRVLAERVPVAGAGVKKTKSKEERKQSSLAHKQQAQGSTAVIPGAGAAGNSQMVSKSTSPQRTGRR